MRIGAGRPICHAGTLTHATNKAVAGLVVHGEWLACATADCVSAWRLRAADSPPAGGGAEGLLGEAMRHELDAEQRRVVTHLTLRDGVLLAAGQARAAKRPREKKGVVSQIDPAVFVLACEVDSGGAAVHGPPTMTMTDVELPSIMVSFFGACPLGDYFQTRASPSVRRHLRNLRLRHSVLPQP